MSDVISNNPALIHPIFLMYALQLMWLSHTHFLSLLSSSPSLSLSLSFSLSLCSDLDFAERIKGEPGTGIYLTLRRAGEEERSLLRQAAEKGQIKSSSVPGGQSQSNVHDVQGGRSPTRSPTDNSFGSPHLAQRTVGPSEGAARGFDVYASPGVVAPSAQIAGNLDDPSSTNQAGTENSIAEMGGNASGSQLSDEGASVQRLNELLNENKSLRAARDEAYAYANQLEQVTSILSNPCPDEFSILV
jgi:hypothetical protein